MKHLNLDDKSKWEQWEMVDKEGLPWFECRDCGYKGLATELDTDPNDDNPMAALWCPICESKDWVWD